MALEMEEARAGISSATRGVLRGREAAQSPRLLEGRRPLGRRLHGEAGRSPAFVPSRGRCAGRPAREAALPLRLHLRHAPLRTAAERAIRQCGASSRARCECAGSAAGFRPLRRRPGAARTAEGAGVGEANPERAEGAREDDGRRARLVPRYGGEVARAVRARELLVRPQGGALHRPDERERERLLDRAKDDADGADAHGRAARQSHPEPIRGGRRGARVAAARSGESLQGHAHYHLLPLAALQVLSPLELLDRRRRGDPRDALPLQVGDGHSRAHASTADPSDSEHSLPRDALDGVAVALRSGGLAQVDRADGAARSLR
ncbi:hypothetical protein HRbin08_02255 [bacterium HR08]|nr:hypothetical protein HRbin08_02255 [bacterium HR08]